MAIKSRAVAVDDSAAVRVDTDEIAGRLDPTSGVAGKNLGPNAVYVGGSDVTTANGVPVAADEWLPGLGDVSADDKLYAVCAAAETAELRMLEVGV